jgi:hypothetical protein
MIEEDVIRSSLRHLDSLKRDEFTCLDEAIFLLDEQKIKKMRIEYTKVR